jgi:tetrahydromethanopterin S-methyltransferase subunit E
LLQHLKNLIFKNLFGILVTGISLFLVVLILLWSTLIFLWSTSVDSFTSLVSIAWVASSVISSVFIVVIALVTYNKLRLNRSRAAVMELEVARNLLVVNGYRQAVLDFEKVKSGEK